MGRRVRSPVLRRPGGRFPARQRRGYTLIEVAISTIIVSVTLVAALQAVAASRVNQRNTGDRARAVQLAQTLLAEITRQSYIEPTDTPVFGRESGELNTSRAAYDDVDDYHNWSATPPQYKDGTTVPDGSGWTQEVSVQYLWSTDFVPPPPGSVPVGTLDSTLDALGVTLLAQGGVDTGIKQITVTIRRGGDVIARLRGIRSVDLPGPDQAQQLPDVIWDYL